jgi:dynein heavy chain
MEDLKNSINDCELKLERAGRLIGGLGGEQTRWTQEVANNNAKLELLPGDVVVAAGMVGYAGAFTSDYRKSFETTWVEELDRLNVVHT